MGTGRRRQSLHSGAYDPLRHRQHDDDDDCYAAGAVTGHQDWHAPSVLQQRETWAFGQHTHFTSLSTPPPASLTATHTGHALMIPGSSRLGGQALLDRGIPQPHLMP